MMTREDLNETLIEKQGLSKKEVEVILGLHKERERIEQRMRIADESTLKKAYKQWELIQFELQLAWGFEQDPNHHRFWEVPRCSCPRMDNEECLGFHRIINGNCKVHGG